MPARFVDLDRQTPMFLPYDLREWAPAGPIVHFILDAVEQLPITDFRVNDRGTGSGQHFEQCYNAQAAVDETIFQVSRTAMHKSVPNGASHLLRNVEGEARQVPRP